MKLQAVLLALVMICLLLFGCTTSNKDASFKEFVMDDIVCEAEPREQESSYVQNDAEMENADSARMEAYSSALDNPLSFQISSSQEQVYAPDNSLLFSTYVETPILSAGYLEDVENRVNNQIGDFLQKREANAELWKKEAETYYNETTSEDALSFYGWSSNTTASVKRMDQNYISVVFFDSAYLGGAHPSNSQSAMNFDAATGTLLPLSAVFDGNKKDDVLELLLSRLKDMEQTFSFYPDYESYVSDVFNSMSADMGQNWYLTDTSVVFFFSPEQISPYAAGVVSVELTYEILKDFLRSDFVLPDHSNLGPVPEIYDYSAFGDSGLPSDVNIVADLSGEEDAQLMIYASSGDVYDLRVYTGLVTENEKIIESTLYAANILPSGSAVLVDAQEDTDSSAIGVEYRIAEDKGIQWVK